MQEYQLKMNNFHIKFVFYWERFLNNSYVIIKTLHVKLHTINCKHIKEEIVHLNISWFFTRQLNYKSSDLLK